MQDNLKSRSVLVTGAGGFTGGSLARELARRGMDVRGLIRSGSDASPLIEAGVEVVEGDIRDRDKVVQAAQGVDVIYHIAAVFRTAGHTNSYYHEVNVGGVENVIAAARQHGVKRVVHCSTIGVHGDVKEKPCRETSPFNPGDVYQQTKLDGERVAQKAFQNDIPGVVFRPAAIYGPGDMRLLKMFRVIYKRRFRMIGDGETLYHMVYIDDLVDGIILCGEHPNAEGQTYILAGPDSIPIKQLAQLISDAVGVPLRRGRIPVWPVMAAAAVCEAVCRPFGFEPPLHRRRVAFFTKNRAFSSEKAMAEIGYDPKTDSAEGIRRTAEWYKQKGLL